MEYTESELVIHILLRNLFISNPVKVCSCSYFNCQEQFDERNNSADQSSLSSSLPSYSLTSDSKTSFDMKYNYKVGTSSCHNYTSIKEDIHQCVQTSARTTILNSHRPSFNFLYKQPRCFQASETYWKNPCLLISTI